MLFALVLAGCDEKAQSEAAAPPSSARSIESDV
jgi:hypothetical protein